MSDRFCLDKVLHFVSQNQFKAYFPDVDLGRVAQELRQLSEKNRAWQ